MGQITFLELIEKTMETTKRPLTVKEIWEEAKKLGFDKQLDSSGKTPLYTVASQLYTKSKRPESKFYKVSTRPTKFYLKKYQKESGEQIIPSETAEVPLLNKNEREYHGVLVNFVKFAFQVHAKTIFHEESERGNKGQYEWLHPDVVGVFFPFEEKYEETTINLQKQMATSSVKIFAFELKKELNFSNLRQYYFQAVSNSSWAHEGYLTVLRIDDDTELRDELARLNNSFGIGVIKLNEENPEQSEIMFYAKTKLELDWETVNLLVTKNKGFREFVEDVKNDSQTGRVRGEYDRS